MARSAKIEVKCDRCDRIEYREPTQGKEDAEPILTLQLKGEASIEYRDLCVGCEKTVRKLASQICKRISGRSPNRKAKEKGQAEPTPSRSTERAAGSLSGGILSRSSDRSSKGAD